MFILWRGKGIDAFFVTLLLLALPVAPVVILAINHDKTPPWAFNAASCIGCFFAAAYCWHFGKKWNRGLRDTETHMLYFLRIEYWGPIFALLGVLCWFVN